MTNQRIPAGFQRLKFTPHLWTFTDESRGDHILEEWLLECQRGKWAGHFNYSNWKRGINIGIATYEHNDDNKHFVYATPFAALRALIKKVNEIVFYLGDPSYDTDLFPLKPNVQGRAMRRQRSGKVPQVPEVASDQV